MADIGYFVHSAEATGLENLQSNTLNVVVKLPRSSNDTYGKELSAQEQQLPPAAERQANKTHCPQPCMSDMSETFSKDITFIIQGLVTPIVNPIIESVRTYFPDSTIIVSTCNPFNIEIIGADQVIRSEDPGAIPYSKEKDAQPNNINRQIRSTLAGLKATKTKYAFKLRSDFFLTGNSFLSFFDQFPKSDPQYQIFEHKLLACCYFSRNPGSHDPYPYHISDLAFFGLTTDMLRLFDIPELEEKNAYYSQPQKRRIIQHTRFWPEQYLFMSCLEKEHRELRCQTYDNATAFNIEATDRYFASNFILLTYEQFCLKPTKKIFSLRHFALTFGSCYTHVEWQQLYRRYADPAYQPPAADPERDLLKTRIRIFKRYRAIANLCVMFHFNSKARKRARANMLEWFIKVFG